MKRYKDHFYKLILVLSFILVLYTIFRVDGAQAIANAFKNANKGLLSLSFAVTFFFWCLDAEVIKLLVNSCKVSYRFRDAFRTTIIGQLFSALTPFSFGGQPFQIFSMNEKGVPFGIATSAIMCSLNFFMFFRIALSIVLLLIFRNFFFTQIEGFSIIVFLGFLFNILLAVFLLSLVLFPRKMKLGLQRFFHGMAKIHLIKDEAKTTQKVHREIDAFFDSFRVLFSNGGWNILFAIFLTAIEIVIYYSAPYFIFLSLGDKAPYAIVLAATCAIQIISAFIPLPGGSGGTEASFYLIMDAIYPNSPNVGAALLLWRLSTYYFPILVGNLFNIVEKRKHGNRNDSKTSS